MMQLQTFWFLFSQVTFFGLGLIAPALTALVLLRDDRKRMARLLLLPLIWLAPLVLGGLFVEPSETIKTARWVGGVGLVMLLAFIAACAWMIVSLKGARAVAIGCVLINAPVALLSAAVTAMAASGDWL